MCATPRQRGLEEAYRAGLAVEGKVEKAVKGGYEVRIARERAFCPLSQIDLARTADPAVHEGQLYLPHHRIQERGEGRRALAPHVSKKSSGPAPKRSASLSCLEPSSAGESVLDFGAFVDLGARIQGLLHVSEMSWSRNTTPGAIVAVGDQITVKVLRVDDATGKISLGLKQLQDDPWATVPARYEVGQVRSGRVTRVAEFGAFVELRPGIEALAHAPSFRRRRVRAVGRSPSPSA